MTIGSLLELAQRIAYTSPVEGLREFTVSGNGVVSLLTSSATTLANEHVVAGLVRPTVIVRYTYSYRVLFGVYLNGAVPQFSPVAPAGAPLARVGTCRPSADDGAAELYVYDELGAALLIALDVTTAEVAEPEADTSEPFFSLFIDSTTATMITAMRTAAIAASHTPTLLELFLGGDGG